MEAAIARAENVKSVLLAAKDEAVEEVVRTLFFFSEKFHSFLFFLKK